MTTPEPPVTPAKARRGKVSASDPAAPIPPVETAGVAAADIDTDLGGLPPVGVPATEATAGGMDPTASTASPAAAPVTASAPSAAEPRHDGTSHRIKTLHLPYVTAIIEVPQVPRPHLPHVRRRDLAEAAGAVTSYLPSPGQLLFYGGLGALAALEVLEWPVAAAVAAGTYVARRSRDDDRAGVRAEAGRDPVVRDPGVGDPALV
jgi:hypothetical protein